MESMLSEKPDGREIKAIDVGRVLLMEEYAETMAKVLVPESCAVVEIVGCSSVVAKWKDLLVVPLPASPVARGWKRKTCRCYSSR
jgi:hypothetical protein